MATSVSPTATSTHHTRGFPHTHSYPNSNLQPFVLSFPISCHRSSPSPIRFHPPSLPPRTASLRRRASAPSPPPPPESDPPPQNDPVPLTGTVSYCFYMCLELVQLLLLVFCWLNSLHWFDELYGLRVFYLFIHFNVEFDSNMSCYLTQVKMFKVSSSIWLQGKSTVSPLFFPPFYRQTRHAL